LLPHFELRGADVRRRAINVAKQHIAATLSCIELCLSW
jgi:hypothetical protein